jgi:hypothetical protein
MKNKTPTRHSALQISLIGIKLIVSHVQTTSILLHTNVMPALKVNPLTVQLINVQLLSHYPQACWIYSIVLAEQYDC